MQRKETCIIQKSLQCQFAKKPFREVAKKSLTLLRNKMRVEKIKKEGTCLIFLLQGRGRNCIDHNGHGHNHLPLNTQFLRRKLRAKEKKYWVALVFVWSLPLLYSKELKNHKTISQSWTFTKGFFFFLLFKKLTRKISLSCLSDTLLSFQSLLCHLKLFFHQ